MMIFTDNNTAYLEKVFKVPSGKSAKPKLKPLTSPAAPVVNTVASPSPNTVVHRVSKFSKPAQARFNVTRKKRRLSALTKSSVKQMTTTSLPPKVQVQWYSDQYSNQLTMFLIFTVSRKARYHENQSETSFGRVQEEES